MASSISYHCHGLTDRGLQRELNEDAFHISSDLGLFIVCDGLGGHSCGEVASKLASESAAQFVQSRVDSLNKTSEFCDLVKDAVQSACKEVYERATIDSVASGMATTLTLALFAGTKLVVAHVGDCRLYLHRNGRTSLLTKDHTMAQELVNAGTIKKENLHTSRYSHVLTRCVGRDEFVEPDVLVTDVLPGDQYVLCSDGLIRHLSDSEIGEQVEGDTVESSSSALVNLANSRGGQDNITVIVLSVESVNEDDYDPEERRDVVEVLKTVAAFRDFSLRRRLFLLRVIRRVRLAAGEDLLPPGGTLPGMYVVRKGELSLQQPQAERTLKRGDSFGELALTRKRPSTFPVVAATDCELLLVERSPFLALTRRKPRLGFAVLRNLLEFMVK